LGFTEVSVGLNEQRGLSIISLGNSVQVVIWEAEPDAKARVRNRRYVEAVPVPLPNSGLPAESRQGAAYPPPMGFGGQRFSSGSMPRRSLTAPR